MLAVLRARIAGSVVAWSVVAAMMIATATGCGPSSASPPPRSETDAGTGADASSSDAGSREDAATDATTDDPADAHQLPPLGGQALRDWLAAGHCKAWHCEPQIMNARPQGAHGRNRVCSNDLLSKHDGAAPFPVGAAAVKELYGSGTTVSGYAVSRKVKDASDGNAWFWGEGSLEGVGVGLCASCHAHAPAFGGHDFVYVRVGP